MFLTNDVSTSVSRLIDKRPMAPVQILVVVLCGLIAIIDGFDVQAAAFAAPAMSKVWHLGREQLGAVFSSGLAGMLLGMALQGTISDRVGRRPIIIASVIAFGLFSLLTGMTQTVDQLIACRALAGVGMGAAIPNILTLTSEYSPARVRTRMMVLMNIGFPIGGLVGGLISISLVNHGGWRAIFFVGGALPLLLGALLIFVLPESVMFCADQAARSGSQVWKARARRLLARMMPDEEADALTSGGSAATPVLKEEVPRAGLLSREHRALTLFWWVAYFSSQILFYSMVSWLPVLLSNTGMAIRQTLLSTTMLNLGSIIGGLSLAWGTDRFPRVPFGTLVFLGGAVLSLLIAASLAAHGAGILQLAFLAGGCFGGGQLLLNAYCTASYPTRMRASGIGVATFFGRLGSVVGPAAVSLALGVGWGGSMVFAALAVPASAASIATTFAVRRSRGTSA
ncbi:MFS transporter [Sphingomonas sp. AP4-R1]|uniref:MFS transporter n=1 Tax=Sphingomonas sp. AP4-R1 TaxID=2735134 RepID=UPI0014936AB0|nr:MFS transporter [Sphingomonas sp. AP4-R1]QJU58173.1 MFS transporter [Sphingomonas sp. AP4-R1]